jgi:pterin-4a-carbinolamine dehydratase
MEARIFERRSRMETMQSVVTPAPAAPAKKLIRPRGEKSFARRLETRLKAERVQEKLRAVPGWRLLSGGKGVDRVREFQDPRVAAAWAQFVNLYAERAGLPAEVTVSGARVMVVLRDRVHRGGSLTDAVLDFVKVLG